MCGLCTNAAEKFKEANMENTDSEFGLQGGILTEMSLFDLATDVDWHRAKKDQPLFTAEQVQRIAQGVKDGDFGPDDIVTQNISGDVNENIIEIREKKEAEIIRKWKLGMDNRKEFQYPDGLMSQDVYNVVEMIAGVSDNSDMYLCTSGTRCWVCSNIVVNHKEQLTQVDGYELVGQGGIYQLRKDSTYSQHLLQDDANVQNLKVRFPNRQSANFKDLLSMMKALDEVTPSTEEPFSTNENTCWTFRRFADMQLGEHMDRIMFGIACSSKMFMGEETARSRARRLETERKSTMQKGPETIYNFCIQILNLRASFAAELKNRMRGVPILMMAVDRSTRLDGYISAILPGSFLMVKSDVYKKLAVVRRDTEDPGRYHYNIARIYHDPSSIDTEDKSIEPVPLKELCTTIRKRMNQYHPNRQNQRMKVKGHDTTFMSLYDLAKSRDWQIIDEGAINDGHIRIEYSTPLNTISKDAEVMYDAQKIMTPEELQRTSQGNTTAQGFARNIMNAGRSLGTGYMLYKASPYISSGLDAFSGAAADYWGPAANAAPTMAPVPAPATIATAATKILPAMPAPATAAAQMTATSAATAMPEATGSVLATYAPIAAYTIGAIAATAVIAAGVNYVHKGGKPGKMIESASSWFGDFVQRWIGGSEDERYEAARKATNEYLKKANTVNTELSKLGISVMFPAEVHPSEKRDEFVIRCQKENFFKEDGDVGKSVKESDFRAAFHNMAYVLTIYEIVQKGDLLWSIIQSGDPCQEAENIFKQMYEITCQLVVDTKVNAPSFGHMLV